MDRWEIVLVAVVLLDLIVLILNNFVRPSQKKETEALKQHKELSLVIQHNTDAINGLTEKIDELTSKNNKDHDHFFSSINNLNKEIAVLKEKHKS